MRSLVLAGGLLAAALLSSPARAQGGARPAAPKPAAADTPILPSLVHPTAPYMTVNGETIPVGSYVDRLSLTFGPQMREALLGEALWRQEAKRRKLAVTPAELNAAVGKVYSDSVRRYPGGEKQFAEELKNTRGWTVAEFKDLLRKQADVQVYQQKIAEQLVKADAVSETQVQARYDQQKENFRQPDSVQISHILVKRPTVTNAEKDAEARKKADDLLAKVTAAKGANFAEVAKASSEDRATAEQGGRIPTSIVRNSHPFGAEFEATVFNAPAGLIDRVIPTPWGFHVIRVDAKKEARVLPLEEVKQQIRESLLVELRREKMEELFVRLRSTAKIESGRF